MIDALLRGLNAGVRAAPYAQAFGRGVAEGLAPPSDPSRPVMGDDGTVSMSWLRGLPDRGAAPSYGTGPVSAPGPQGPDTRSLLMQELQRRERMAEGLSFVDQTGARYWHDPASGHQSFMGLQADRMKLLELMAGLESEQGRNQAAMAAATRPSPQLEAAQYQRRVQETDPLYRAQRRVAELEMRPGLLQSMGAIRTNEKGEATRQPLHEWLRAYRAGGGQPLRAGMPEYDAALSAYPEIPRILSTGEAPLRNGEMILGALLGRFGKAPEADPYFRYSQELPANVRAIFGSPY